jgi:hypothetical protein
VTWQRRDAQQARGVREGRNMRRPRRGARLADVALQPRDGLDSLACMWGVHASARRLHHTGTEGTCQHA